MQVKKSHVVYFYSVYGNWWWFREQLSMTDMFRSLRTNSFCAVQVHQEAKVMGSKRPSTEKEVLILPSLSRRMSYKQYINSAFPLPYRISLIRFFFVLRGHHFHVCIIKIMRIPIIFRTINYLNKNFKFFNMVHLKDCIDFFIITAANE